MASYVQYIEAADNEDIEAIEHVEKQLRMPGDAHLALTIPMCCMLFRSRSINTKKSCSDILNILCSSLRIYEFVNIHNEFLDGIMLHTSMHDEFRRYLYENASDVVQERMIREFNYSP